MVPGVPCRCYTSEPSAAQVHRNKTVANPLGAKGFDGVVNLGTRAEVPVGLVKPRAKIKSQF